MTELKLASSARHQPTHLSLLSTIASLYEPLFSSAGSHHSLCPALSKHRASPSQVIPSSAVLPTVVEPATMPRSLFFAAGLGAVKILAAPQSLYLDYRGAPASMFGNWTQVKCTDYGVTDASLPSNARWSAVDAGGAWSEAVSAWNNEGTAPGHVPLPFTQYLMNFFHGPDNWNCQDIGSAACAPGVLQCGSTNHPAGWMVMNSLANLHEVSRSQTGRHKVPAAPSRQELI